MPNLQLRDYIAAQLRLGVTKEAVRAALIQSGWAEVDINVAMNEASAGSPAVAPVPRVATREPQPSAPSSDAFRPKEEPMFSPNAVQPSEGEQGRGKISRRPFAFGAAAIAVLALLGGAGALLWGRLELQKEIETLRSRNGELAGQIAALTKDNDELNARVIALTNDTKDVELQLSFFAAPPADPALPTAQAIPFVIVGKIAFSVSTGQFALITNRNAQLFVENSKDRNVDAALRPFIGTVIDVSGTYLPGARLITVTHVKGLRVQ